MTDTINKAELPLARLQDALRKIATSAAMVTRFKEKHWDTGFSLKYSDRFVLNNSGFNNRKIEPLSLSELQTIPREELYNLGFGNWDGKLLLIPIWAYEFIEDGMILTSISGNQVMKGADEINFDTRGGCLAYGVEL